MICTGCESWLLDPASASRRIVCAAFPQFRLEPELLNLARQRIASPSEPCGGFHPMSAGMRERATNERLLEFLLETIADVALAANQRLRELAVERLLPADLRHVARR